MSFGERCERREIDQRYERGTSVCALEWKVGQSELLEEILALAFRHFCTTTRISLLSRLRVRMTNDH